MPNPPDNSTKLHASVTYLHHKTTGTLSLGPRTVSFLPDDKSKTKTWHWIDVQKQSHSPNSSSTAASSLKLVMKPYFPGPNPVFTFENHEKQILATQDVNKCLVAAATDDEHKAQACVISKQNTNTSNGSVLHSEKDDSSVTTASVEAPNLSDVGVSNEDQPGSGVGLTPNEDGFVPKIFFTSLILGIIATVLAFWATMTCHFFRQEYDDGTRFDAGIWRWDDGWEGEFCFRYPREMTDYFDVPLRYVRAMSIIVITIGFLLAAAMVAFSWFRVKQLCRKKGFMLTFLLLFCLTCTIVSVHASTFLCEDEGKNICKWGPGAYATSVAAFLYLSAATILLIRAPETDGDRDEAIDGQSYWAPTKWVPVSVGLLATIIVLSVSMNCRFLSVTTPVESYFIGPWRRQVVVTNFEPYLEHTECKLYHSYDMDYWIYQFYGLDTKLDAPAIYARAMTLSVVIVGSIILVTMVTVLHRQSNSSRWKRIFSICFFLLSCFTVSIIMAFQASNLICPETELPGEHQCRWGPGAFMTIVASFLFLGASYTSKNMKIIENQNNQNDSERNGGLNNADRTTPYGDDDDDPVG